MKLTAYRTIRMIVSLLLLNAMAMGEAAYELTRSTIDAGGVIFSARDGFELSASIGQPYVGVTNGDGYTLGVGFWFGVITSDAGPVVSTRPPADTRLSAAARNHIKIVFQNMIACGAPKAGDVVVQELLSDPLGSFGRDLSESFTFMVDGTTLTIEGTAPSAFRNKTWYRIANLGNWPCGDPFDVDFLVQIGDANNDGFVNFTDLSVINESIPTLPGAINENKVRQDIDGNRFINFTDLSVANAHIPSFPVGKPPGH